MPVDCKGEHARAVPIVRNGLIARSAGGIVRGDVHWCQDCGALRADVPGEHNAWVLPGPLPRLREVANG